MDVNLLRDLSAGKCEVPSCPWLSILCFVAACFVVAPQTSLVGQETDAETPKLRLRATPRISFLPANVLFIAEIQGGDDDYEPLYCASVEWVWDDDTRSETIPDCDPYEAGVSEIQRRFSIRHTFQDGGTYEVRLHLKKRNKVIESARTSIQVRGESRRFR